MDVKPVISYDDFTKLDIRVGVVTACEVVPKSKKLLKLQVDFGPEIGTRTIVAGISPYYTNDQITNQVVVGVVNLAPRELMGITSHGMLLAAHNTAGQPILLDAFGALLGSQVG